MAGIESREERLSWMWFAGHAQENANGEFNCSRPKDQSRMKTATTLWSLYRYGEPLLLTCFIGFSFGALGMLMGAVLLVINHFERPFRAGGSNRYLLRIGLRGMSIAFGAFVSVILWRLFEQVMREQSFVLEGRQWQWTLVAAGVVAGMVVSVRFTLIIVVLALNACASPKLDR
jgi:hypothetical protein